MKTNERKQLAKKLEKLYWDSKQYLYVRPIESMEGENCYLSIYAVDKKKKDYGPWLFDIQNYKNFFGLERTMDGRFYQPFDVELASCSVGFKDRTYTLPKFESITEEDILKYTERFVRKELDMFLIFNLRFVTDEEIEKLFKPPLILDERYFIKL